MKAPIVIALLAAVELFALEGVLDASNNHWGQGGNVPSPVVLEGVVTVPNGITLTIEPGAQIQGAFGIDVSGGISAVGQKSGRITFNQTVTLYSVSNASFEYADFIQAGLSGDSSSVTIKFCRLTGGQNQISLTASTFFIENSIFSNAGQSSLSIEGGSGTIKNCASYHALGVHVTLSGAANVTLTNTILSEGPMAIYVMDAQSAMTVSYSILNAVVSTYGAPGTVTMGSGVQEFIDPLFVNALNGNFHLQPGSPAVDQGDPADSYANEPQGGGGRIDIGAYGNTDEATSAPAIENPPARAKTARMSVSPNPAEGGSANMVLTLPAGDFTLSVFDLKGRLWKTFFNRSAGQGIARVLWNCRDESGALAPPGVYLCRLNCGQGMFTQRFFIIK